MLLQHNEDNESNGMVTWSSPTKQLNLNHKTNDPVHSSSSSHAIHTWRRTLYKLLNRKKSNKDKKGLLTCFD
jgi:hypothetical protein